MAAKIFSEGSPRTPLMEFYPIKDDEAVVPGELLYFSSGVLTKATGTNVPTHIAMSSTTGDGVTPEPCIRIDADEVIEIPVTFESGAVPVIGTKVTVHTDGLQVTNVTTNGIFTVIYVGGTATGCKVRGRFE